MTKTFHYEARIESCSRGCPFFQCATNSLKVCFCTHMTISVERARGINIPIMPVNGDSSRTYLYVERPNSIPNWCPLKDADG
jgi:hypothetical protein